MSWLNEVETYLHITPEQLKGCMPNCPKPVPWARAFDDAIERFGINDIAMFMAQVGHESLDLTQLEENLNYSAERMTQVWPSRFPAVASARPFARNPEALANNVYANRMGNRHEGDGWRFRGRGPIQLTGRYNYTLFSNAINDPSVMIMPDQLIEPAIGALASCWFYATHVPEGASVLTATRKINGGTHGLEDRQNRYERCRMILQ